MASIEIILLVLFELFVQCHHLRFSFCDGAIRAIRCVAVILESADAVVRKEGHFERTQTVSQFSEGGCGVAAAS